MVFESVQSSAHLVMLALRLVRAQPANLAMMDRSVILHSYQKYYYYVVYSGLKFEDDLLN